MNAKRLIVILLVLVATLSVTMNGSGQDLKKQGKYWLGEITKTFKVNKGGTLDIKDIRGDVTVTTWTKDEVKIHEIKQMDIYTKKEAAAAMKESEAGYTMSNNTIHVGGSGFNRKWIQSSFDIVVPVQFNCNIKTRGGDLAITNLTGKVMAVTGGGDIQLTKIDGLAKATTGGGDIVIKQTSQEVNAITGGGDVDIVDSQGPITVKTGGGDVTVYRTKDQVIVTTGGGDIEISNTIGNLQITTGGGEIHITEANGDVTVTTGGGEIEIHNIKGNFQATTGGGSISVKTITGTLRVTTGGGDIELLDIKGAVKVTTGGGDVSATVTLKDFSKEHSISISTGGGDIELFIPGKLPATIDAQIRYRTRKSEDYKIDSVFPLKTTTKDDGRRYRIIQATGDINGGGDPIKLKTGGGNINIKKLH